MATVEEMVKEWRAARNGPAIQSALLTALQDLGIWDAEVLEWRVCEDFPVCGHPIKGGAKSVRVIVLKEE